MYYMYVYTCTPSPSVDEKAYFRLVLRIIGFRIIGFSDLGFETKTHVKLNDQKAHSIFITSHHHITSSNHHVKPDDLSAHSLSGLHTAAARSGTCQVSKVK
jgi:hypothetical protein